MRTMTHVVLVSLLLCFCAPATAFPAYSYYDAAGQRWVVVDEPPVRYEAEQAPTQVVIQITPPPAVPAPVVAPVPTWIAPDY